MAKKIVETPLMKQYIEMKGKHPDAILLFRVGDFYETFSDDAIQASEILGITLTRRANGQAQHVELAGFPHHALDSYLPRLVRAGKRVAICEQLEDPKLTKKLVKRGIIELVTPGVVTSDNILNHNENNFLAALHCDKTGTYGLSLLDLSTGEFLTAQGNEDYIDKLLSNFAPKELIVCRGRRQQTLQSFSLQCPVFELDEWVFELSTARERLLRQFGTMTLKGFGIDNLDAAIIASGAIMHYLDQTQHTHTSHITALRRIEEERYVRLDKFTVRNLELVQALGEGGRSLLDILDRTSTPMGARTLRRWLLFPLKNVNAIVRRHEAVEWLMHYRDNIDRLASLLEQIGDLERLTSKISTTRVTPREMVQLANAINTIAPIADLLSDAAPMEHLVSQLDPCEALGQRITATLRPDAPTLMSKGNFINDGVNDELDNLRRIAYHGKEYLAAMQARESERTSIPSLKIGFNNVFGYYIEVTNTHRDKVPPEWIRKQTLVNAERYITQELKEYEEKILTAEERITTIEQQLFTSLIAEATRYIEPLQTDATTLSHIDVLAAFARVSLEYHYNRPVVDDSLRLAIHEGRHPVIERRMRHDEQYIANSVSLDNNTTQVMMITGPNMSGKSALLRQTALNVIMAQIGCFVAADAAQIGIVDKIFTRVGASDNISLGESTFMVEMNEAAAILNNMSERSLILFDELGRGTSTYDGISIAWAIVEHIHADPRRPKTLFATHYHELNDMEQQYDRIANFNVSVREIGGKVVFLRKLARGGSEHSFGIHVAKLAGMPPSIVRRADAVLKQLEESHRDDAAPKVAPVAESGMQLSFFQLDDPVLTQVRDEIANLDIDNLTPMAALNKLHDIKAIITGRN